MESIIHLDSDVLIEILSKGSKRGKSALRELEQLNETDIRISSIVYEEVLFGVLKQLNVDTLPAIHPLSQFPVVNFSKEDAELAAQLEVNMEKIGKKKPRGDILVASTSINQNAKLFSFNTRHYKDIENLQLITLK